MSVDVSRARPRNTVIRNVRWAVAAVMMITIAAPQLLALTGRHLIQIQGGSMAPAYQRGDVILSAPPPGDDLRVGRILIIGTPGSLYAHRVIDTRHDSAGTRARLQGDANSTPDPAWITQADVYAIPDVHITGVAATVIMLTASPLGAGTLILVAMGLTLHGRSGERPKR